MPLRSFPSSEHLSLPSASPISTARSSFIAAMECLGLRPYGFLPPSSAVPSPFLSWRQCSTVHSPRAGSPLPSSTAFAFVFKPAVCAKVGCRMLLTRLRASGIQGVGLVAVTYVYFLIFAQFAFIHRLDALGISDAHLKSVMAAMAIGGIALSLLAPRLNHFPSPIRRLQCAFGGAAVAAFLTITSLTLASAMVVSTLIGTSVGLLTVTLVTHLRLWIGGRNALLKVGLSTGIGYFLSNVPSLFNATPQIQSAIAGLLCLVGVILANLTFEPSLESQSNRSSTTFAIPFPLVVASFAALIWLDSAAFFIIQNTPALKAGTWQGTAHLWANALIHLCAAVFAAQLLR